MHQVLCFLQQHLEIKKIQKLYVLLGTLTSKINEQLGAAAMCSSTPTHNDVEAQNNANNNSREFIVTSQVAT